MAEGEGSSESKPQAPASGMPRIMRWLGLLTVIGGILIAIVMTMFDELMGRKASALGSLQVLGIVIGICGSIFGLLLYAMGSFSLIEARQREISEKLDRLAATGIKAEAAVTAPAPAPQRIEVPAQRTVVAVTAPEPAYVARPEPGTTAAVTGAPASAADEAGAEEPEDNESGAEETEEQLPSEPATDVIVAPAPQPAAQEEPVQEAPAQVAEVPDAQAQQAPAEQAAQEPQAVAAAPQPQEVPQPAYDYTTAAAPNAQTCPVCGGELQGNRCPHCELSARIQEVYYEISKAQGMGVAIEEANSLLNSARQSLNEKAYEEAAEFAKSAMNNIQETTKLFTGLQKSVSESELAKKKFEEEGKDTLQLAKLIPNAKTALEEGRYPDAKLILEEIRTNMAELEKPPAPKPSLPEPPKRSEISACPKCSKKVMAGWKKCPYCLTPLA